MLCLIRLKALSSKYAVGRLTKHFGWFSCLFILENIFGRVGVESETFTERWECANLGTGETSATTPRVFGIGFARIASVLAADLETTGNTRAFRIKERGRQLRAMSVGLPHRG